MEKLGFDGCPSEAGEWLDSDDWYVKAKPDPDWRTDRVLILQRGQYRPFVRERTCRNIAPTDGAFECSECHRVVCATQTTDTCSEIEVSYGQQFLNVQQGFKYCPCCGARVVE